MQAIHGGARVMAPASRIYVAREIDSNGDLNGAALFGHALGHKTAHGERRELY